MSLSESPTLFMMSPARKKNGRASSEKLSMAEKKRWGSMVRSAGSPTLKKPNRAVSPMANPMGTRSHEAKEDQQNETGHRLLLKQRPITWPGAAAF